MARPKPGYPARIGMIHATRLAVEPALAAFREHWPEARPVSLVDESLQLDAARANGFSDTRIILRHMVPNVMAPYLIMITAFVGQAILLEASLSFLGLGVQDPVPAWGLMLRNAQEFIRTESWIAIWPGVAISLGVFGFNLFGDAVRDALDPKLRTQ